MCLEKLTKPKGCSTTCMNFFGSILEFNFDDIFRRRKLPLNAALNLQRAYMIFSRNCHFNCFKISVYFILPCSTSSVCFLNYGATATVDSTPMTTLTSQSELKSFKFFQILIQKQKKTLRLFNKFFSLPCPATPWTSCFVWTGPRTVQEIAGIS